MDIPAPPFQEDTAKAGQTIPQELVQNHTVEQSVDTLVPPFNEKIVDVGQITPQDLVKALASKEEKDREGSLSSCSAKIQR